MNKPFSNSYQFIAQLKNVELQIRQNQLQEAAQQLNQMAKTAANDPRLYILGARLAEAAHNPEGVLMAARKAHTLAPDWPTASLYLAEVLASRGEADEALAQATLALQQGISPTSRATNAGELLAKAAMIAQLFERHDQALQWLRLAEQLHPNDASIQYYMGQALLATGEAALAAEIFGTLNLVQPDNTSYAYYLAVARGETPATQPAEVVADLFNRSIVKFDATWAQQAQYTLPADVAQLIKQWHPDREAHLLDLGCGTGLIGASLGKQDGAVVGVDVSLRMIDQATKHGVYDKFHQVNLLDALQDTPEALYHVITAIDVLGYVGQLDAFVSNAHRILLPEGRLVFSFETGAGDNAADFSLVSQRYAHQPQYVQRLLEEAGFTETTLEARVLRVVDGQGIEGYLVTARK